MVRLPVHTWILLCLDGILIILCALHVPSLIDRAQVPFRSVDKGSAVRVTELLDSTACLGLAVGDQLVSFDGQPLPTADAVEFLSNFHAIGDRVQITYRKPGDPWLRPPCRRFNSTGSRIGSSCCWWLSSPGLLEFSCSWRGRVIFRRRFLHASHTSLAVILITAFEGVTPHSLTGFVSR